MQLNNGHRKRTKPCSYIAIELDLSSLRLQQYQEVFSAFLNLLILGLVYRACLRSA
ncbi:hypothetical protein O9992_06355 [Vibrio lentus]|nr:hypothetical protein [Vibrio lentus]